MEYERRRLQGTWQLDRFEVVDSSGNNWVVKAQANLTYDEYGNLRVEGKLLEPMPGKTGLEHPLLGYNGAIDTSHVRRYELTPNTLRIWYLAPDGNPTAIASFSR